MSSTLLIVVIVVVTALAFDFTNGFHDSANAMATSVATGALKPKVAVIIAAVLNVIGACLSTEVAKTISGGIVNDHLVTAPMVFAGLIVPSFGIWQRGCSVCHPAPPMLSLVALSVLCWLRLV